MLQRTVQQAECYAVNPTVVSNSSGHPWLQSKEDHQECSPLWLSVDEFNRIY